jgi:hypothetical protein
MRVQGLSRHGRPPEGVPPVGDPYRGAAPIVPEAARVSGGGFPDRHEVTCPAYSVQAQR